MSTRGIIIVKKNGRTCCAQYNRCDSYPRYCGKQLAEFLSDRESLIKLSKALDRCEFVGKCENDKDVVLNKAPMIIDTKNLKSEAFENDREILDYIITTKDDPILLRDESAFAEDTLFCEYAWVIDFKTEGDEIKSAELRVFAYGKRIGVFDVLNDDLSKVDWDDLEHEGVY